MRFFLTIALILMFDFLQIILNQTLKVGKRMEISIIGHATPMVNQLKKYTITNSKQQLIHE